MNQKFSLCFEIHSRSNPGNSGSINHQFVNYESLLETLAQVCSGFVVSFRCLYAPLENPKLRSFILINLLSEVSDSDAAEKVLALLTKGSLSQSYKFSLIDEGFPSCHWVRSIGEITKFEEFVNQPGFMGYLPHPFETGLTDDSFSLSRFLETAGYQELVLEFSLETSNSLTEQALWKNALDDLVNRLSNSRSRNSAIDRVLELYKKYQDYYSRNQLFSYSIKSLGRDSGETFAVLTTMVGLVGKNGISQKSGSIITFNPDQPEFLNHLQATQSVSLFKTTESNAWQSEIGRKLKQRLIKETVNSGGFIKSLPSSSIGFPVQGVNFNTQNQARLPSYDEDTRAISSRGNSLELRHNSLLYSQMFKAQLPTVEHLKPLSCITTAQEVLGFFQFFLGSVPSSSMNTLTLSAEKVFDKYRHLITRDTYIIGLDDAEDPIISSWAEIPHRLIAGLPGAGKTNFLNWVIFQFLYANPKRKIYIADFGGVDFQHLERLELGVEIIDTPEDCPEFVEKIHREEYEKRLKLMQQYRVSDLKLLQNEGVDIDRTLWIIDEAADIADVSYKLRDSIEKRLKEYARKGRKYGIHVLYCTQRPTTEVITKQVTDQCEEKTIFRVTSDASQRILDKTEAGNIPKTSPGRAWLDGYAGEMFVNVPKMKKPEGSTIPVSDTLWHHFPLK
jgi:hypothetical protein